MISALIGQKIFYFYFDLNELQLVTLKVRGDVILTKATMKSSCH